MAGRRPIDGREVRRAVAAAGIHLLFRILRGLPRRAALRFCQLLGRLAWMLDRRGRRVSLTNIEHAFGARVEPGLRRSIGRSAYINLAANLADLSRVSKLSTESLSKLVTEGQEGFIQIEKAVRKGRGIIILTPHLGNWELLTAYLGSRGAPVHFVGREPYDERLDALFESVRCSHGAGWIRRGGAFGRIREVLNEGELVLLLIDQDTSRVRGTYVDFFGRPAWTATGPAVLARLTGATILPTALIRLQNHSYRLVMEPPIRTVDTSDEEYDDWENTRRCTLALESLIERFPAQWVWFHRRWRIRPPNGWVPPEPPGPDPLYPIRQPGN